MKKTIRSFRYAGQGLLHCGKERNFRIQLLCAGLVITGGILFDLSIVEWYVVIICIAMVLSLEMINTALEHLCNVVHREYHPAVRIIKDVSAGAVLLSAFASFICAALIFIPRIIFYLSNR